MFEKKKANALEEKKNIKGRGGSIYGGQDSAINFSNFLKEKKSHHSTFIAICFVFTHFFVFLCFPLLWVESSFKTFPCDAW